MKKYDKLVRDKIPELIYKNGHSVGFHTLSDEEFKQYLRKKLTEEVDEYLINESLEELADIVEVLYALAEVHGHSVFDLGRMRRRKLFEKGGFVNKICLEYVGD